MAHSPAPWTYQDRRSPAKIMAGDDCVAMVYLTHPASRRRDYNHEGNARLIAAAPELLALVQDIFQAFDADLNLGNPHLYTRTKTLLRQIESPT